MFIAFISLEDVARIKIKNKFIKGNYSKTKGYRVMVLVYCTFPQSVLSVYVVSN